MDFLFIKDTEPGLASKYSVGGKAMNLFKLKEIFGNVPPFIVIPKETFSSGINDYSYFIDDIMAQFPKDAIFAVRSSGTAEDSAGHSFAGQYETYLFVPKEKLIEKIRKVYASAAKKRVEAYIDFHQLEEDSGIAVIVQQMIDADVSGVAFGIDPVSGNRNAHVINAVLGLGEGLVSGELNADTFHVDNNTILKNIVSKNEKVVFNAEEGSGLKKITVSQNETLKPTLSDDKILEISSILNTCKETFRAPQDIEFAIKDDEIFMLQSRPVTGLNQFAHTHSEKIVWDNSNIIESYPGVTTPLTFSFISKSYEGAYKLFSAFMGVSNKTIASHENVFANTLGFINGRVYYNLKNWYVMLAMLPGYSINARFMEKMMGVKERFDVPADLQSSKTLAWWRIVKMFVRMYFRFLLLPKERKKFQRLLDTTIKKYKHINYEEKSVNELMNLYRTFEQDLLNHWKAPLLNDFFAMIWFGLLEKRTKAYLKNQNLNLHNDLLCGSNDIISVEPIHRTMAIASIINGNEELKHLFLNNDAEGIWKKLQHLEQSPSCYGSVKNEIEKYIGDFGERCVGELKLETISYTQHPALFISVLQSYLRAGITTASTNSKIEEHLRLNAEKIVSSRLKANPIKKYILNKTLKRTRGLVSSRENLRYERTRAFGIVRMIFNYIGKNFSSEGIIENARDIFYLTKEEIFSFIEGTSVTQNIKAVVLLRKQEFERYRNMEAPAARFTTYGMVYHANDFKGNSNAIEDGDLKGMGCSPGQVKAKVRVIFNPEEVPALNGDILVTISTDPGWVTLFPGAGGIIVERGSLLSHSAIVAREMGKPCIVGVTAVTKILKTGDIIEMDGNTGVIKMVKNEG